MYDTPAVPPGFRFFDRRSFSLSEDYGGEFRRSLHIGARLLGPFAAHQLPCHTLLTALSKHIERVLIPIIGRMQFCKYRL